MRLGKKFHIINYILIRLGKILEPIINLYIKSANNKMKAQQLGVGCHMIDTCLVPHLGAEFALTKV